MNRFMSKLIIGAIVTFMAIPAFANNDGPGGENAADATRVLQTRMALRDLWVEHVFWIRSYVVASQNGNETESQAAADEVVANAKALAQSIEPFYGQSAADGLFNLLAGHWGAVSSFNTATIEQSESGRNEAVEDLTANAKDIAVLLSGANPYLPEDAVFGLLSAHGAHHVAQISQLSESEYEQEAATWHDMRKHMLVIADAITDALAKQFPEKF